MRSSKLAGVSKEIKIVFLSDLHNKSYGKDNQKLLESIQEEQPDLILVGGDMVVAKFRKSYIHALKFMLQLPQMAPVYVSNGNHEQRMKEYPEIYGDFVPYKSQLVKAGIVFLENEYTYVNVKNTTIKISGFELPMSYYDKEKFQNITSKTMDSFVGKASEKHYQILLAHYPQLYYVCRSWGADLVLAGHFHGGFIRIPGWRGLVTPKLNFFPKHSGELTTYGNQHIIVSKGLGTHTIPLRFLNPAEMVVVTLRVNK